MAQYFSTLSKDQLKLPIYLESIGVNYEETSVNRPHGFPTYQWIQCASGEGVFKYEQKEYQIKVGQALLIYPHIQHYYYGVKKPWLTHWVSFDGYSVQTILESLNMSKTGVYNVSEVLLQTKRFNECLQLATANELYSNQETASVLFQFLIEIAKYSAPLNKDSLYEQRNKLQPVLQFIDQHYFEPLTIETLAEQIHITAQYLCVLFQRIVKKRPFEYVNQVRVNKSKELMISDKQLSISVISQRVGFENASYFGAQFKKIEGLTPGQFKELFK